MMILRHLAGIMDADDPERRIGLCAPSANRRVGGKTLDTLSVSASAKDGRA